MHSLTFASLNTPELKARLADVVFVTATEGHHGRGVAWAAEQLGLKAVVFMPKGSSPARARNIRQHGAECTITELNYDDTVRLADKMAQEKGWILLQDTAWDGSFAGSIMGYFIEKMKDNAPAVIIVEPHKANCLYRSAVMNDGEPHAVGGDMSTLMAGLACGEPNTVSWPIIRDYTTCFISADDRLAANGMRILAAPRPDTDTPFISGESGAIGAGLLYELMSNEEYRELKDRLALNIHSHVLLISTEGDTSPDIYEDIVWFGRNA